MNDFPDIWEITTSICQNQQSTLNWLIEQDIFYNTTNGIGVIICINGNKMKLVFSGKKGLLWQCSKRNCCNRSKKTIRTDSFFYRLKAPIHKILMVIYLFLTKSKKLQIQTITKLHHHTIESIIEGIYDIMEQDLLEEDVQIGKIK